MLHFFTLVFPFIGARRVARARYRKKDKNVLSLFRIPAFPRISLFLAMMTVVFGIAYLFVVNSLAITGFETRDLSQKIVAFEEQHKAVSLQRDRLQSWVSIADRLATLSFVEVPEVTYIDAKQYPVARRSDAFRP